MRAWEAAFVFATIVTMGQAHAADCRQAIAVGLDVSGSVDREEYALQRDGMVAALLDADVRAAILQMPDAPVWMTIYEWSGTDAQRLLVPWTAIRDAAALDAFALALAEAPRFPSPPGTAVGDAMRFGLGMLEARAGCWTLTLDLAGDGRSNVGPRPSAIDTRVAGKAVTVNALVVALPEGHGGDPGLAELSAYFIAEVIRGPRAFAEVALGYPDFVRGMSRKLLKELSSADVAAKQPHREPQTRQQARGGKDRPFQGDGDKAFQAMPVPVRY